MVFSADDGSFLVEDIVMVNDEFDNTITPNVVTMIGEIPVEKLQDLTDGFRVLVLANLQSFGGSYPSFENYLANVTDTSDKNIFKNNTAFIFTTPNTTATSAANAWRPTFGADKSFIPMFGFSEKIKLPELSDASPWGDVIIESDISMLRSLAKIEIIDNITDNEIDELTLSSSYANGRYIPDIEANPNWDKDVQISTPSLPANGGSVANLPLYKDQRSVEGKNVWIAYIPEMSISSASRPVFNLLLGSTTKTFTFDNYYTDTDGKNKVDESNPLTSVLRNHIYRYTVSGTLTNLSIEADVLPWDMEQDEDVHFDLPRIREPEEPENPEDPDADSDDYKYQYYLKWVTEKEDPDNPGSYIENGYTDNDTDMLLLMKAGTDDYAECQFTLAAPLNATWIAQLVPLQGEHDAFEFVENYSSGKIDGKNPAIVKIRNTRETVANERNEARLVIMVEYPDKTQKEAFVVKPGSNANNYTIVQQKTTID